MELKSYQKKVIADLTRYLELLNETKSDAAAFRLFWQEKSAPTLGRYQNVIPGVPNLCFKVPTGGGKTFIACNAVRPIFDALPASRIAEKMQHGSNNKSAQFTDVELMTAYLWGAQQGLLTRKSIYNFIRTYHLGEFQKLPSYQAFCRRLNRLAEAFAALAEVLFEQKLASSEPTHGYVLDSCPVMVSVGSRSNTAKTARNLCNLTRNPTKNLWYHGVKLHVFAQLRPHQLPIPCAVQISKASLCDLWAAKQIDLDCAPVTDGRLYADRAYIDAEWRSHLQTERNVALITPRKRKKYDVLVSEDAVSTRISALRQPIEVFFNWLQAKTHIQSASHVRSCAGLLFHIFSSLAFAALLLRFNY